MSCPWLMHLTLVATLLPTCSVLGYRRNYNARYGSDIPQWKQRACEKTQNNRANSHYICDEKGDVKCLLGWQGDLCQVPMCRRGCDPMNGYCQRPGECRCRIGYTGELCEKCIPLPGCSHGGYCTKPFECLCKPGWDGLFCTEPTCRQDCHSTRGYCEAPGECRCRIGWGGRNCSECAVMPGCAHGTCSKPLECQCLPGYTGLLCQTPLCASDCHRQRGYCTKPGECRCKVGWTGSNCDKCFPYPGCVNGDCQRPWECNCKSGWGGMLCNEKLSYCQDNPNTCRNGGECLSLAKDDGDYRCLCRQGYFGKNCENVDEFLLTSTVAPKITPPPLPLVWQDEQQVEENIVDKDEEDDDNDNTEDEDEDDDEEGEDDDDEDAEDVGSGQKLSIDKTTEPINKVHIVLPTTIPIKLTTVGNIDSKVPTNATYLNSTTPSPIPATVATTTTELAVNRTSLLQATSLNVANNASDIPHDIGEGRNETTTKIFPITKPTATVATTKATTLVAINDTKLSDLIGTISLKREQTIEEEEEANATISAAFSAALTKTTTKTTSVPVVEASATATPFPKTKTKSKSSRLQITNRTAANATLGQETGKNVTVTLNEQKAEAVYSSQVGASLLHATHSIAPATTRQQVKGSSDEEDEYDDDDNEDEDDEEEDDDEEEEDDVVSFIPNIFDNEA